MGPLSVPENEEKKYGVQLNSEPTDDVMINIAITRPRDNSPANVYFNSATNIKNEWQLIFTSKNWSDVQVVTLYVGEDSVDNENDDEDFLVIHTTKSNDKVYSEKAGNMTVIVRVEDNDVAGVKFKNNDVLEVTEGDPSGVTFQIVGLSTLPLKDVVLKLTSPLDLLEITPSEIYVSVENAFTLHKNVTIRALEGTYTAKSAILYIKPASDDPKYQEFYSAETIRTIAINTKKFTTAEDCNDNFYFNDTAKNPKNRKCVSCPQGSVGLLLFFFFFFFQS